MSAKVHRDRSRSPDFKTIANFRKDNGPAIRGACRQIIVLCRQLNLLSEAVVAVDGSKFKAVNNRDRKFTSAKVQKCKSAWSKSKPASIDTCPCSIQRTARRPRPLQAGRGS